jgi:retron-type reverse transcriptase
VSLWDKLKSLFNGASPAPAPTPSPAPAPSPAPRAAPQEPAPQARAGARSADPFEGGDVANLSLADVKRAGDVLRARTTWDWRTDAIPPRTDPRTALVERAMVLRGAADEGELVTLHAIGDEWLRHADAQAYVAHHGRLAAQEAVAALRAERAERKQQLRAAAAARRAAKRAAIEERKRNDVFFLGRGVSAQLSDRTSDDAKLSAGGLPVWRTPADVARALDVSIGALRQLAFHAEASPVSHYVQFDVPKKTGGVRRLAAPLPRMAHAQRTILTQILERVVAARPLHPAAHGFVADRSTVTNARPHVAQDLILNIDLADFFPSIRFGRVRALFSSFGYSGAVSTVLALLCTECARVAVPSPEDAGKKLWIATTPRALPQGACTSPLLSNLICRRLDARLTALAHKRGYTYTRYADDLTFSARGEACAGVRALQLTVAHIAHDEGFAVRPDKTRVLRKNARQEVTGVVVNATPHLARDEVRRLRAIVHDVEKRGWDAANREGLAHFPSWLRGRLAYLQMIDPVRGATLSQRLDAVAAPR